MNVSSNGPTHDRAKWVRPRMYGSSLAFPRRYPRLMVLRSSCGHALGVGYAWKRQGVIAWKACR